MDEPNEQSTYDTDVPIVGAGPIGLTTAAALGHHGVRCRVLEERTETKPYSRANNVWARPQELLASVGVRDALAEKSYLVKQVNTLLNGRTVDPVAVEQVDSPYPQVLYSGQDVIETTLSEQVAKNGNTVERGKKVVELEERTSHATYSKLAVRVNGDRRPRDGRPSLPTAPSSRLPCRSARPMVRTARRG